jgi:hypothetical protein
MILIHPPASLKEYLNRFIFELADETTIRNIKQGLSEFYPDDSLKLSVGYDYSGYLDVKFKFETEADAVMFKLKYAI